MPGSLSIDDRLLDLHEVDALILDIDGVLYEGHSALPGSVELIAWLNRHAFPYILFSNNTTRRFKEHVERLAALRMPVPPASILTAARVTAETLAIEHPGARCLVVGEAGLSEALQAAGLELAGAGGEIDGNPVAYVVVGLDRALTYEKLKTAARAIRNGAELISSNPDLLYPDGGELIPASGVIQAALEAATGQRARVTGKPELPGFWLALNALGCPPERTAMLGDQLEIDILGAKRAGLRAFLVLSSITPGFDPRTAPMVPDGLTRSTLDFYKQWIDQKGTVRSRSSDKLAKTIN